MCALKKIPIHKVWGIGPKNSAFLNYHRLTTAFDLKKTDIYWIRKYLTVVGEKIVKELRQENHIQIELFIKPKKNCG